ncbi:putative penicillin acylase (penicillin amidase) [Oceanicola granulosus HTCC2516]|uniref:Putative penicillin acylase (Penicillin amidase) n=2 Tax=Oceanicola granulosus (strain ATCC BAA-861 / DSM 15982 / KCTC 12143 / HTCC2516) TaxID=314256 RepID=Q2CHY8_OCEGH|nr:penicillin acylase family protein [Oceanicola granulosus]EAR52156.1 putative penicillin acylase (penicillin amidase) [Oceanicola granulosus HTCC2516]
MALLFHWLLRIATALVVLGIAAFALAYYFAARSLPDYDRTYEVAGISAPVEIVRDNANVPHIFGARDDDVFFALGYAHAQDRMWQMTMLRRTAQGRLSELFGARTVGIDKLMRRLDLYTLATRSVDAQDRQTTAALEAYAAGVNSWFGEVNAGARGRGAPEMWLFNHAIAPWQPADSIAIVKLMALEMQSHLDIEVLRARASLILEDERVDDLLPSAPGPGVAALPRYGAMMPGNLPTYAEGTRLPDDPLSPINPAPLAGASNAWAAGIARSATGSTLLANDPHLGLSAPSLFYLARLELSSGGVIGGTIPGVPVVLTGRSADLGWGVTSAYADDIDVFVEEVNPDDAREYRTPDGWKRFETRDSIVVVKGGAAQTLRLQWTDNGPVLPPDLFELGTIRPPGHVTSVSWTVLSDDDTSLSAAMALMRAHDVEEALEAGARHVAPAMVLTVADRNRIALKLIGALPARDPDHRTRGRMPSLGYIEENRWQGTFPASDNPVWVDPEGGILGHTNNKIVSSPFPRHVSYHWGDSQRVARWVRLMQSREVHTRESFIEAQLDTVSFTARALLPLIGADLWFTGDAAPEGTPERQRQIALTLLAEWNGEMNEHLPEPLLYAAWVRFLQERLIRDELGPLAREFTHLQPLFIERVFRDLNGASRWCDVIQSAPTETCTDIARQALDDALVWIGETYGSDLQTLRWGDAHEARHDHSVLGEVAVLRWFVNIRQSTSGGDNTLMRGMTLGTGPNPMLNVHAAVYRGVYDFADPDSSVFITSTGQSGHPLSRYYDHLGERWRRGEYIPMSLDPSLARGGAVGVTVLRPAVADAVAAD